VKELHVLGTNIILSLKNERIVDEEVADNVRNKLKKSRVEEKNDDHEEEDDDKDERSERRYVMISIASVDKYTRNFYGIYKHCT
jgi:hypothetical protein